MPAHSDLSVHLHSDSLSGMCLDVVVSGSIGAVESVRFIRALRRLGARVIPWLTSGGAGFITETALSWAAGGETVRTDFEGERTHLSGHDAVVIAPASASFLARVASGQCSDPASALVASSLGLGKPVLAVPNMHDSLGDSPFVRKNMTELREWLGFIEPRKEEGKLKFPEPMDLADEVSHRLKGGPGAPLVLLTMGSTKGYIDDVRYISNYSSGGLGSAVSEELYRQGFKTHVIAGDCPVLPRSYSQLERCEINAQMEARARAVMENGAAAAVLAASVLDYIPESTHSGKLRSRDAESLEVKLVRTGKIISTLNPISGVKVGFKLESGTGVDEAREIARDYLVKYGLSLFVINELKDVSRSSHRAVLFQPGKDGEPESSGEITGKQELARMIVSHIQQKLAGLRQGKGV